MGHYKVSIYQKVNGRSPFVEWLDALADVRGRAAVRTRIARLRLGNFGVVRSLKGGVFEFKIDFGPGYRVYFGRDGASSIVLLTGGTKRTQSGDIESAIAFWQDYNSRNL